jgi:hypothetical protein
MTDKKSPVFEKLGLGAHSRKDLEVERLVAYSLYKIHKRIWCVDFEKENGRQPNSEEKLGFAHGVSTSDQLTRYVEDARGVLFEHAMFYVENERPEIEKAAIESKIQDVAVRIEKQNTFGRQIVTTVISTLSSTIILIILAVGIHLFGIDLLDALNSLKSDN